MRTGATGAPGNGWTVRAHLYTIVALFAVLISAGGAWHATIVLDEAEVSADRDTSAQAHLGAAAVADALQRGESVIVALAARLPLAKTLFLRPAGVC